MSVVERIEVGTRVLDTHRNRERVVRAIERLGRVVKLWFDDPRTGGLDQLIFPAAEVEERFQILTDDSTAFGGESRIVRLVAESYRLAHAYLFNPIFATETSLIDPLPHQLLAVYDHLLPQARLRFLLADDAGAGKTIMAGLYIREMLLRRAISRVLVVPPAGLVGNWERELRNLFRLRFRILSSADGVRDNPFEDARNDLAIVSVDTAHRPKMRAHLLAARPYDLVIFDEAHKLSAYRDVTLTLRPSKRYELAADVAAQGRHLLLLTATPHMGKDDPYYFLWRLLEPELLSTPEAFKRLPPRQRSAYMLRRMKEAMVRFDRTRIYPPRESITREYPLNEDERALYDATTEYCELHYNRALQRNRSAAGLAMSVLQRRLASSTWALLRSLERRETRLAEQLRLFEEGLLSEAGLEQTQQALPSIDIRDAKTGEEEEPDEGSEESEKADEQIDGATDSVSPTELRTELEEVRRLVVLARTAFEKKHESKFERLWSTLREHPETKVLVFTEHRDTMSFLVDRLEGLGLTGKIARIHGGMDYREREREAERFRDPEGARYLIATDAAGEGINLQFCWVLVNYDIPWNPARLEQRMGRVHRYKQQHDVLLFNLIAADTREGRVLSVLLEKLERIRKELGSDKVFDVIGDQFGSLSLRDLIFRAVVEGKDAEVAATIDRTLTKEKVEANLAQHKHRVECSDVRNAIEALEARQEQAELRRMMPAYVRGLFEKAAPLVGASITGDTGGTFSLDPCPESVRRAAIDYPEEIQNRLTFKRELAMPPDALSPRAIYLHPGEQVFEAVMTLFLGRYGDIADRGGVFLDPGASEPWLFYLAKVPVVVDRAGRDVLDERMIGVRRSASGSCEEVAPHMLLDLFDPEEPDLKGVPSELAAAAADTTVVQTFVYETAGTAALERAKHDADQRVAERQKNLRAAYTLQDAELLEQRKLLKDAVAKGEPAARSKLETCERERAELDARRSAAEASLLAEADSIRLGPVTIYAQALVLPMAPEEAARKRDARIEAIAVEEARRFEERLGAAVEDVSNPKLAMGFDLRSTRPGGEVRYIEVKGRARVGELELTENEWAQAKNHPDRYWLYVVYDCETAPRLKRIKDPAGKGIGKPKGGVTIDASEIIALPDTDD